MSSINRVLLSVIVVGGVTVGALQLDRDTLADLGHAFVDFPQYHMRLQSERIRATVLKAHLQRTLELGKQKRELARELVAGRTTLRQAAARFGEVSKGAPYPWDYSAKSHPEWSQDVRCAQYMIDEVPFVLNDDKTKDPAKIIANLQAEKEAWQAADMQHFSGQ